MLIRPRIPHFFLCAHGWVNDSQAQFDIGAIVLREIIHKVKLAVCRAIIAAEPRVCGVVGALGQLGACACARVPAVKFKRRALDGGGILFAVFGQRRVGHVMDRQQAVVIAAQHQFRRQHGKPVKLPTGKVDAAGRRRLTRQHRLVYAVQRRAIAVGNIAVAHPIDFLHGLARGRVDGVDLHGAASVLDMADTQRVVRDDQVATGVVCEIGGAGVAVMGTAGNRAVDGLRSCGIVGF